MGNDGFSDILPVDGFERFSGHPNFYYAENMKNVKSVNRLKVFSQIKEDEKNISYILDSLRQNSNFGGRLAIVKPL